MSTFAKVVLPLSTFAKVITGFVHCFKSARGVRSQGVRSQKKYLEKPSLHFAKVSEASPTFSFSGEILFKESGVRGNANN